MTRYYIIEHPTRGVLKEVELGLTRDETVARFSLSGMRGDEGTVMCFSAEEAVAIREQIPKRLADRCQVRVSPGPGNEDGWEVVA
jgi:hypothetical protein